MKDRISKGGVTTISVMFNIMTALLMSSDASNTQTPQLDPPGTIDGAKTPQLIPDQVAYSLVFRAIAEPDNPSAEQNLRARSKIGVINLSEEDTVTLMKVLAKFLGAIEALDSTASAIHRDNPSLRPGSMPWEKLVQLNTKKANLLFDTISELEARLSPGGLERLRRFVLEAKRGMKIFPN